MLRLHMPDGKVVVEPLLRTAKANGLAGADDARQLVLVWEERGYIKRRPDGGYDVRTMRPRPDVQTVRAMRAAADLEANERATTTSAHSRSVARRLERTTHDLAASAPDQAADASSTTPENSDPRGRA